jgi:2,3-dihydroxy-p-cumate/2,3-dihydroxybenzoate 3,4-dioxygenase
VTDRVKRLGFVALGVRDFEGALRFYRDVVQLTVTDASQDEAFLTGGREHHWIRLHRVNRAEEFRVGYEAVDEASLDEVTKELQARDIPYSTTSELSSDWVDNSIRFKDPDGVDIELYVRMAELPVPPLPSIVRFTDLLHAVWAGADSVSAYRFYHEVLGFEASDWIERLIVFMRCGNKYHHSLGIASGGSGLLDHVCFLVQDIDDVMRARNHAISRGVGVRQDVLRHAASGSISVYVNDPVTGIGIEFCTAHRIIEDDEQYRARILKAGPVVNNLWLEEPAPPVSLEMMQASSAAVLENDRKLGPMRLAAGES